ncbi:GntR family transcriptional regulator [Cytobacillus depressus]|uniref:GntR family transcriptional regulator n=1 Tax=Cytobacillus depressus TaxID=1602942 RepID=A0A6L3UZ10_9BACI|nr:GntR family transcriptional regulator [Cytobacillus depressus]KAB2329562.1 GntR family transcriptional regulator [Cytobacillus depressus]
MGEKKIFNNLNLNDRVYIHLRDKIINNEIKPGSKIEYELLMEELGISRTPLRDALNRLQHDKLVEIKPRSGTHVCVPTPKDIQEVYDVRKSLEMLSIETAVHSISASDCQKLFDEADFAESELKKGNPEPFFLSDHNFHRTVIQYSDNSRIIDIMESLEAQIKWFGIIMTINLHRPNRAIIMHRKIIQAIYERNIEDAKLLMGQHLEEVRSDILNDFIQET